MADEDVNEDQWLYGDSNPDKSNDGVAEDNLYADKSENSHDSNAANQAPPSLQPPIIEPPKNINNLENSILEKQSSLGADDNEKSQEGKDDKKTGETQDEDREEGEDGELDDNKDDDEEEAAPRTQGEDEEEDDDDDSEDDVNVVIGEIKTSSQYTIKRGGLLSSAPQMKQPGKFSIEEFETIGTINGVVAHDFSLDSLEDKPWRKPGADITDYFNYGFNEETWRSYCERQKRMRIQESGVGINQLTPTPTSGNLVGSQRANVPMTVVNENSKYSSMPPGIPPPVIGSRKILPPTVRRLGDMNNSSQSRGDSPPKGNSIQVMTADRREYSRKSGFPDMSVPPPPVPTNFAPDAFSSEYGVEYYNSDMDPYYQAYEPTQDSQWANADADKSSSVSQSGVTIKQERDNSKERDRDRDRDRERDRERSERGERHRERSHRHRSRSRSAERRSRKHKSRSRSPGHRSHKKKKSKKSDRNKEDSE